LLRSIYEIAIRIEAERREAEEERIRASADPLPLEDWKQDVCFIRKDPKGQREVMVTGKLMVPKDLFIKEVECRDMELKELRSANDQMKAQVSYNRFHGFKSLKFSIDSFLWTTFLGGSTPNDRGFKRGQT